MNQDGRWKEALQKLLALFQKYKLVLLVLAAGLILLLWPQGSRTEPAAAQSGSGTDGGISFDLEELENRMEKVLSKIDGAGSVSLLLTVKSGTEQVYATDVDYSEDAEHREESTTTVLVSTGSGAEEVAVVQQIYPTFQGALVVCDGGNDPTVRLLITQAVAALTGLRSDKITVCR